MKTKQKKKNIVECHRISVPIHDGSFSAMKQVCIPLTACLHLQDQDLRLSGTQWTARQTKTRFSISFFWSASDELVAVPKKPRWRQRKRQTRAKKNPGQPATMERSKKLLPRSAFGASAGDSLNAPFEACRISLSSLSKGISQEVSPGSAVQVDLDEPCLDDEIDQAAFEPIHFEVKQNIPRATHAMKEGDEEACTSVVGKRCKRKEGNSRIQPAKVSWTWTMLERYISVLATARRPAHFS